MMLGLENYYEVSAMRKIVFDLEGVKETTQRSFRGNCVNLPFSAAIVLLLCRIQEDSQILANRSVSGLRPSMSQSQETSSLRQTPCNMRETSRSLRCACNRTMMTERTRQDRSRLTE